MSDVEAVHARATVILADVLFVKFVVLRSRGDDERPLAGEAVEGVPILVVIVVIPPRIGAAPVVPIVLIVVEEVCVEGTHVDLDARQGDDRALLRVVAVDLDHIAC